MVIKQIKPDWWSLTSSDGEQTLLWFGQSRAEVLQKFRSWIRDADLEKVRYRPKGERA
jgi:hypothetical protein